MWGNLNHNSMKFNPLILRCFLAIFIVMGCTSTRRAAVPATTDAKREVPGESKKGDRTTSRSDSFLVQLLESNPNLFGSLLHNKDAQIQIIYTQINRDVENKPTLSSYYYGVDPAVYFYPASTVKMPVALLALQRINELSIPGLDKNTTMITDAAGAGQTAVYNDPSAEDGRPSIAQYIKKIFLVSDNDAFNRLYEFLGQEYINNTLHRMGYADAQILHRLNISRTVEQNKVTNPVTFYSSIAKPIYIKPVTNSKFSFASRKNLMGKGYYSNKVLVTEPFDFSKKNRLSLLDINSILQSIIFPETVSKKQRFNVTEEDRQFVWKYMSMKPKESPFPSYDSTYNDSYSKFLLYGGTEPMNEDMRIFNKEGDAYGFLTDAAYFVDFKNGVEFMLSATILCNSDGIFNDDHYDYETIGYPFLKNLGKVIYQYDLKRTRKYKPDLSVFKLDYTK